MESQTRKIGNDKANHKTDFYEIVYYFINDQHTALNETFLMDSFDYLIFKDNHSLVCINNLFLDIFELLTKTIKLNLTLIHIDLHYNNAELLKKNIYIYYSVIVHIDSGHFRIRQLLYKFYFLRWLNHSFPIIISSNQHDCIKINF